LATCFTPSPLSWSTAIRMIGDLELVDQLQRGVRQAYALLDGRWGTIPWIWWYRFEWQSQRRIMFDVDGRIIEATEIVIDRPPLVSEQRNGLVEAIEHRNFVKAMAEAITLAAQSTNTADKTSAEHLAHMPVSRPVPQWPTGELHIKVKEAAHLLEIGCPPAPLAKLNDSDLRS
jgi:hypothetical protein